VKRAVGVGLRADKEKEEAPINYATPQQIDVYSPLSYALSPTMARAVAGMPSRF